MKKFDRLLAVLIALVISAAGLHSQILYGSLVGNVRDASGAAMVGVRLVLRNVDTGQTRESLTGENGGYSFVTLLPGTYDLTLSREGFKTQTEQGVVVVVNNVARRDAMLQVGQVSDSVTVEASAATLQTDRAEIRAEVTTKELLNIPTPPGRNYQNLFITVPGFSPPRNAHSVPANPSRALQFNVNGTSSSSNNTRIDGASSTNVWLPHIVAYVPALESIETVNVVTNSFDAEQGLAGGAAVNVQIKSGTNELHGSAFEYYNSNATKAKPFFLPQGQRNPKYVFNQYGGTIGGPVVKNKLFYFASYEATRDRRFASSLSSIPTEAMRRGDLSGAPAARPIFDPATGTADNYDRAPFPGSIIPSSRISPAAARLASLFPTPIAAGTVNNYFAGAGYSFDRDTLDTKVNFNASEKLTTYARISILDYRTANPGFFGENLGGPPVAGGQVGRATGNSYSTTFAATYVAKPNFIIDAYFGWTRMQGDSRQPRLEEKVGLDVLKLPGTNGPRFFEGGMPQFQVSGFTNFGHPNNFMPYLNRDPQFQYVANANWNNGRHQIRFGADFYQQQLNQTQPEFVGAPWGAAGGFGFAAGQTSFRARPGQGAAPNTSEYNSWASFLLGRTNNLGRLLMVPDVFTTRTALYSAYIRDQWQVNSKLTFNMGVRWEYFPFPTRADRGLEQYDFGQNKMLVCGVGVVPKDCGVHESKRRFAPRAGLAYRVSETFVVRAGYGITNDPYNLGRPFRTNHPLLIPFNQTAANSWTPASRFDDGIPTITAPALGNGVIDIGPFVEANTVIANQWTRGYIQSWNLALQKKFGGWVGEAAYVATRAVNQLGNLNRNAGDVGGGNASRPLARRFGRNANTIQVTGLGTYTYDSLQTKLERRFANGFQALFAYTFSKNMGTAGNINSDGGPRIHLPQYFHLNRAVSDLNIPHNFQFSGIYELPFGKGKKLATEGPAAWLLGGWQVNALLSAMSGQPFSVTAPGTDLNAPGNGQRADLLKPNVQKIGGVGPGQVWYDPTAFGQVREARFGTAGWNILQSPGIINLDGSLFRSFRVTERVNIQFRAEAFNLTNTPHFNSPVSDVANSRFMQITSVRGTGREGIDERMFRFGLRIGF